MYKKCILLLLFLCFSKLLFHIGTSLLMFFFVNSFCTIIPHKPVSATAHRIFLQYIKELLQSGCSLSYIMSQLKKMYHCIQHISIKRQPHGSYWVSLHFYSSVAKINQTRLLLSNGATCPCAFYACETISEHDVELYTKNEVTFFESEEVAWVRSIPTEIAREYTIVWHSPVKIWLLDKAREKARIPIAITINTSWHCIKEMVPRAINAIAHQAGTWVADVRFQNQIIIKSGGKSYGTNTS